MNKNVVRFNILMEDASLMQGFIPPSKFAEQPFNFFGAPCLLSDFAGQRASVAVFHEYVDMTTGFDSISLNFDDILAGSR